MARGVPPRGDFEGRVSLRNHPSPTRGRHSMSIGPALHAAPSTNHHHNLMPTLAPSFVAILRVANRRPSCRVHCLTTRYAPSAIRPLRCAPLPSLGPASPWSLVSPYITRHRRVIPLPPCPFRPHSLPHLLDRFAPPLSRLLLPTHALAVLNLSEKADATQITGNGKHDNIPASQNMRCSFVRVYFIPGGLSKPGCLLYSCHCNLHGNLSNEFQHQQHQPAGRKGDFRTSAAPLRHVVEAPRWR